MNTTGSGCTALGILLAAALAWPAAAHGAYLAYTAKDAHLRTGPAREYPVVAVLHAGMSIEVHACLPDYRWCDVIVGADRGWVYAKNIITTYQGRDVPVLTYGAWIGIGIVLFDLGLYWDEHYRFRPWYPQRHLWIGRPGPRYRPIHPLPPPRHVVPPAAGHWPPPSGPWVWPLPSRPPGVSPPRGPGVPPPAGVPPHVGPRVPPPRGVSPPGSPRAPPPVGVHPAPGQHLPPSSGPGTGAQRPPRHDDMERPPRRP